MKKLLLCLTLLMALQALAQDPKPTYNASKFGIRSDGVTMNTRSIQFAIDWIAEQGGGTLRFWVGRYLTGSIHMKSNVTIELMEGAILVGSTNPFDYDRLNATNDLEIRITTTMGNYLKTFSREENPTTWVYVNHPRREQPLQSMGLLGPVRLYHNLAP